MIKGIVRFCANELKRESIEFENKTTTFHPLTAGVWDSQSLVDVRVQI